MIRAKKLEGGRVMTGNNELNAAGTISQPTATDGSTAIIDEILTAGAGNTGSFAKNQLGQPLNALNRAGDIKRNLDDISSRTSNSRSSSPNVDTQDTLSKTNYGSYKMFKVTTKESENKKKKQ